MAATSLDPAGACELAGARDLPGASVTGRPRTAPIRTCIGCRKRVPASELVRLVLVDGQPTVDVRRALAGRGASLHASETCVRAALGQGGFGRAFRRRIELAAPEELLTELMAAWGGLA